MAVAAIRIRQATEGDAPAIAAAHVDSIRTLGPGSYTPELVDAWAEGLEAALYVQAMHGGEVFFVAEGELDGVQVVLGFATHRVDDAQDATSVYVRGGAARRGIGTALLRRAEERARAQGAKSLLIQASLVGVEFYRANGFEEVERGRTELRSGKVLPCVRMRKHLGG